MQHTTGFSINPIGSIRPAGKTAGILKEHRTYLPFRLSEQER